MRRASVVLAARLGVVVTLAACTTPPDGSSDDEPTPSVSAEATATPSAPTSNTHSAPADASVVDTVVRFSAGAHILDVTIGEDSPATRDFLSMLPMTLVLEEFNGREKIADLPRELEHEGSPGSDPEDGDLIYFIPWGNIGFYYNAEGIGYSDQTLHLGTYDATEAELADFERQETTVEIVE